MGRRGARGRHRHRRARLGLDSGTLTPLLRRLEAARLITRTRGRDDERRRVIALTKIGRDLREQALDIPEQMAARYPAAPRELGEFKDFLDNLADQLT